ncbi:hypothetical protein MGN01_44320 [Methylobacterium gnaphalii]|uniref:Uncharacterized protein n=1 Tax=Methylobacterium gnaphalii TaxID=1010610 RepID=A0A512JRK3_9HYPH|nr:hypothetical protein MGN01_44320 [Methylobacterium gnaphalii]GLS51354.1 hypothetical protein GCM10007885_42110 [Methylobacterium gnaphalii]
MPERAGQPTLAYTARAGDHEVTPGPDPVAGGELEEQGPVQAAMAAVIDVLDTGGMAQPCGAGAGLEALLPPGRGLVVEQQSEPLGVAEGASLRVGVERLEARGHAAQSKFVEETERGVGEHRRLPQWK